MKRIILALLILTSVNSFCQTRKHTEQIEELNSEIVAEPIQKDDSLVYDIKGLEVKPEFPGGKEKMDAFIKENFNTPKDLKKTKQEQKVYVLFKIEKDGSLSDIKSIKDVGHGTGEEAIRVLKLMPKWLPGQLNGKPVRSLYAITIPVN
ncbi:MAG: energy transducer TonB [Flavobacterium sp.]